MITRKLALVAVFVATFSGVAIFSLRPTAQTTTPQKDDATPIQEGVMTEKQRQHSTLFNKLGRGSLVERLKTQPMVVIKENSQRNTAPDTEDPAMAAARRIACGGDYVVTGIVTAKVSQLTEDGTYIFTDYEIRPLTALKGQIDKHDNTQSITLSEPGGKVILNGKLIVVENDEYPSMSVGQKYLFSLARVPGSEDFRRRPGTAFVRYSDSDMEDVAGRPTGGDAPSIASRVQSIVFEPV